MNSGMGIIFSRNFKLLVDLIMRYAASFTGISLIVSGGVSGGRTKLDTIVPVNGEMRDKNEERRKHTDERSVFFVLADNIFTISKSIVTFDKLWMMMNGV